jgi:hypothetical protein
MDKLILIKYDICEFYEKFFGSLNFIIRQIILTTTLHDINTCIVGVGRSAQKRMLLFSSEGRSKKIRQVLLSLD